MGLSASQGRMLLLTARKSDLEFRAQQISQKRLLLSQQLEEIALEYENATSDRQMKIFVYRSDVPEGQENEYNTQHTNLTYASLISGTLRNISSENSGIQLGDKLSEPQFHSTTSYRLVDAEGNIVVSHVSEIPTNTTNETTTEETASKVKDGDTTTNVYNPKTYSYSGSTRPTKDGDYDSVEDNGYFAVIPENSALNTFISSNNLMSDKKVNGGDNPIYFDGNNIKIADKDGNYKYYNLETGAELTADEQNGFEADSNKTLTLVKEANQIPKSEYVSKSTTSLVDGNGLEPMPGTDNKYRVGGRTYVVDNSLRSGSTDTAGSKSSPNYLQDCLRNGKYLLEQGLENSDTKKYEWKSISWDTTANISDGYYQENDDKAKAKYDRLQQQIQNQDKKLEIELDNIETQRQAVTTEQESVKKVINENIEGSFNAFA